MNLIRQHWSEEKKSESRTRLLCSVHRETTFSIPNAMPLRNHQKEIQVTQKAISLPGCASPKPGVFWEVHLGDSVAAIDTQIRAQDVVGRIRQQEDDRAHQVLGPAHLALGDQGGPLLLQVGVVFEYLLGAFVPSQVSNHTGKVCAQAQEVGREAYRDVNM